MSDKKFVFKSIRMKRLNVEIMTFMFHRWDKYNRNSNVSKGYFLILRIYTDLQQLYGVAMNLIVKISGFYHWDQQLDGNHKSLAQIVQPYSVQLQVYLYYVWYKGYGMLKNIQDKDKLSYYMLSA